MTIEDALFTMFFMAIIGFVASFPYTRRGEPQCGRFSWRNAGNLHKADKRQSVKANFLGRFFALKNFLLAGCLDTSWRDSAILIVPAGATDRTNDYDFS